ncbi:MAG: carboxypeptidase regulatory-like domain-containing protein, partial [Candidatus Cloacimonetes bacterium]|nr:carboxypeptidase regulatory-like domain-containing protein [Candidatus Cloacimonadota bacterium]
MNRRIVLPVLLAIFALGVFSAFAQTYEYSFSTTTGTYEPITGGLLLGTETSDDQRFVDPATPAGGTVLTGPGLDIGFNFTFNGAVFDRLAINNNGWISLGQSGLTPSVNIASTSGYTPLSSTTAIDPPVLYNRIAGMARDLQAQAGASLRLETIGTAPNRVCVVQFANYKKYGTSGTGDQINFQIRLHETSNNVQIVYGQVVSNATAGNMQVGLRGPDVADFNARQGDGAWDNTTAATANTEYVILNDVNYPANGLTFNFNFPVADQPPNPANLVSPADGAILVSPTATLNWMSGGGLPNGYRFFLGTDPAATNIVNNQDLGAVNSYDPTPDLNLDTTYYWKVVPYNGFGDASNCPIWSFTTHGDPEIDVLPYTQNWDLVTAPALPFDWTNIIQSTSTTAFVGTYASTTYAHSQPNTARLYNPSDADATLLLVGPPLAATLPVNAVRVKFWARSSGANYPLSLGVLSDPTDASTYTEVHALTMTTTLTEYIYDMTTYAGTGTHIAFKHGLGGTGRSHYIDDISFEQIGADDLGCYALVGSTTPSVGDATTYIAVVQNWGTAAQDTYTVKLFDGANVELATTPGVNVAPGTTIDIPLTWTPTVQGEVQLYAKVFLTGDINPANDQSPNLTVSVQPAGATIVGIGDGTSTNTTSGSPTPYGTYYKNFHQQYLYTAAEILAAGGAPGLITALSFNVANPNNCSPMPNYTIKLKHTDQAVLTTTFEVGDYSQVWFQNDFVPVAGWNVHTLSTPFFWNGNQNLLVDIVTTLIPGAYTQNASVYYTPTTGTNTCLRYQSDSADAGSSATGTTSVNRANIRMSLNVVGMAELEGNVSSAGNPVADAAVVIAGTTHATVTDVLGNYNFPYVEPGTYNVTASKLGFESLTLPVTLVVDETTTLNFVLTPSSSVNVTGFVVGSDQPTVGLAEATVSLTGIMDYSATTDATGHFTIPGVLSGNTYNYVIVKEGYQNLTGSITVGATAYDMGTLILPEIAFPPSQVVATENIAQTQVDLIWHSPVAAPPYDDFEMNDGGWVSSGFGDWEWDDDYDVTNYTDIDTYADTPPPTAYSGTGMWGTVLEGGYSNCAAWSYLRKTFNLSGISNPVLSLWHYMDGYNTWDYGLITVNGTTVWGASSAAEFIPWQELTVDLSAYGNQANVEIGFEWYATSVVSYAGWYIDDVYVGPPQTRTETYVQAVVPSIATGLSETEGTALKAKRSQSSSAVPQNHVRNDRVLTGYKVWRLLAANEGNETLWTPLTPTAITDTTFVDTAWAPLPSGVYKFAVKAVYTNDVLSAAAFSNEIHKGMMGTLSGTVTEFGTNVPIAGATITAGDYNGTSGPDGSYAFLAYQGTYDVTCAKQGYQSSTITGVNIVGTQTTTQNFVLTEITLPPGGVTAAVAGPAVNVTWSEPGTAGGEWIQYSTVDANNSIGLTSGGDFSVAIRFPATALQDYAGMSLQAIKFWPGDAATYTLKAWTGGDATAPAVEAASQPVTVDTYDAWMTVNFNNPVGITGSEELWFGYNVVHTSGLYPAGCDPGPALDGFGNMIYNSGAWTTLLALSAT